VYGTGAFPGNNYITTEFFISLNTHTFIAYVFYEPVESFVGGMGEISSPEHLGIFTAVVR
jgi:hypothetical protein